MTARHPVQSLSVVLLVATCASRTGPVSSPVEGGAMSEDAPGRVAAREDAKPAVSDGPPAVADAREDVPGADRAGPDVGFAPDTMVRRDTAGAPGAGAPNVVVLFADDLGWADLSSFGARGISTPHLDRLAAEGTRLTDFYVPQALCSPSRAALLTGRYPRRFGVNQVYFPQAKNGLPAAEVTIAEHLRAHGYRTAMVGKWHLGDAPQFLPTANGFDSYFGIPYSNDMTPTVLMRDTAVIENPVDQRTLARRYAEEASKVIGAKDGRPFFLYLAFTFPHVPLFVSPAFQGKSAAGLYGDVVQELDWSVGEVMGALRTAGVAENTVVFFASDNGPWLEKGAQAGSAGPFRDGKFTVYEGGVRSPGIAWGPGRIPAGRTISAPLSTLDLFPTIAGLAGAPPPAGRVTDGRDVLATLAGQPAPGRDLLFFDGKGLGAMRAGPWKVHVARDGRPAQLYDLEKDPGERTDLAAQQPAMTQTLQARARSIADSLR